MRIISGTARGCKLSEFSISEIRPTPDRVREALFSILVSKLGSMSNCFVLDLYAGTGAMGLEAISRGAESATFVDQSTEAVRLIHKNASAAKLTDRAEIIQAEILRWINGQMAPFDLIFMDPPYGDQGIEEILLVIAEKTLLKSGGILCVETARNAFLPDKVSTLVMVDQRKYGSTSISLYEHGGPINA